MSKEKKRDRRNPKAAREAGVLGDTLTLGDALLATKGIGTDRPRGDRAVSVVRITPDEARATPCPKCGGSSWQGYRLIPDAPAQGCMRCGHVRYLTEPWR